jgi:hypothetical protein
MDKSVKIKMQWKNKELEIYLDEEDKILLEEGQWIFIPQVGPGNMFRMYSRKYRDYFHRLVMNAEKNVQIDHIDNNPLNNTKNNLRKVNNQQNSWNKRGHADAIFSKYKGVSFWRYKHYRRSKPWLAQIKAGNIRRKKYFATEIEAAKQYNDWAKELHGEFAKLNNLSPDFDSDLKIGQEAEDFLIKSYPNLLKKSKDLRWDLETLSGKKIEVKYDRYPSHATNNLFIERISNNKTGSLGGPYRSLKDGVDYYLYMFKDTKEFYLFDVKNLIIRLERITPTLRKLQVKNKHFVTHGYAVPKNDLIDLILNLEDIL